MKLGTLQYAIYRAGFLAPYFPERLRLASSIDKIGVIASEPVAYAFIETVSLDIFTTTQSKRNNNNK
jgi:hypothetical protein